MKKFDKFLRELPDKIQQKVNLLVSALREAAHDIYVFGKTLLVSTYRIIRATRLALYVLFGFVLLACLGLELVVSDLGFEFKIIGWLCITIGVIVTILSVYHLAAVPWRLSQQAKPADTPTKIPMLFFIFSVVIPMALILFITFWTSIQFRSWPLKPAQAKLRAGVAYSKERLSIWSKKLGRETPPPGPQVPQIVPSPQREQLPKPQPQAVTATPPQPIVVETFHARVTCEPESVHTRGWDSDPGKPENKVDMTVESIDMDESFTTLHVAVAIHEREEFALLKPAKWAYITDNNGNRYDLSQDDVKGYPNSGNRELKFGEIARLDLQFPKFDKLPKIVNFSHPQFPILKVNTAWYRVKHRAGTLIRSASGATSK